jgi:hypothetical protein
MRKNNDGCANDDDGRWSMVDGRWSMVDGRWTDYFMSLYLQDGHERII